MVANEIDKKEVGEIENHIMGKDAETYASSFFTIQLPEDYVSETPEFKAR